MNLRPEVQKFAEEMEKQLRANEHKGGWKDCPVYHLTVELRRNRYELERVALHVDAGVTALRPSVIRRAANIANFAIIPVPDDGEIMTDQFEVIGNIHDNPDLISER